ncbi:MAG: DUF418 domain-containing protein [Halorhodospira sp.]
MTTLDALRGFALLGILVVNIQMFSGWGYLGAEARQSLTGAELDAWVETALALFAEGKFYSLFSLLFGYSFVLLAQRAGPNGAAVHRRRMLGLLGFGLVHGVLFWPSDILAMYAVVGLALPPFFACRVRVLYLLALGLLVVVALLRWAWVSQGGDDGAWLLWRQEVMAASVPSLSSGTFGEVVRAHLGLKAAVFVERLEALRAIKVFALFLLGAAAAQLRLLEPGPESRSILRWLLLVGLGCGLLLVMAEQDVGMSLQSGNPLHVLASTFSPPLMAIGYASALALWSHRGDLWARCSDTLLSFTGRMALTHYIGQSMVCNLLFYGYGLSLFAEFSLARAVALAFGIFLGQVLFSALWLKAFRQGPLEWVWRWQIQGQRPKLLALDTPNEKR